MPRKLYVIHPGSPHGSPPSKHLPKLALMGYLTHPAAHMPRTRHVSKCKTQIRAPASVQALRSTAPAGASSLKSQQQLDRISAGRGLTGNAQKFCERKSNMHAKREPI